MKTKKMDKATDLSLDQKLDTRPQGECRSRSVVSVKDTVHCLVCLRCAIAIIE